MHDESGKTISVLCIVPKDENIYISLVEKTSDSRGKDTLAHDKSTGDYAHFFKKHASSVGVFSAGLVAGCALARHYCSK